MTPSSIPRALATAGLLAALALGLAACGGDEPAPVVQPPAPQPAPFQPQPVEVALGQHGGKLTLMTKEGGGFTLNGEDVADGAPVTGEENGLAYKLALADGKWAAEYQAASASVMLGQLGGTLALSQNEDKTWSAGGEALPENLTVPGDNGLHYKLALGEDGAWSAEYQAASASVMLGQLGGTLALSQNEDKTWSAGGEALPENLTVPGDNGLHYKLALGEDGAWSAEYQAASASVMLGQLGGTLALSQNEDKTWSLPGGEAADGALVGDAGGPQYRLAQNEDGAWAGAYVPRSASAALGTLGGTLALDVAEDGSAWLGGEPLAAGREVAGPANGLQYRLAQGEDGSWAGQHVPATQPVALGGSGRSVELAQAEDGTWSAAGSPVADGAAYADSLGLKWTLSLADGKWAAAHQAATASVMLGQHGGTLDLAQAEDGSWTLASGEPVPAKLTVPVAGYDNAYAVTRDPATGEYSAAYVRDDSQSGSQAVAVGLAGSLQLYRAEDGSWSASPEPGGDPVAHGHVHPAASGDAYALSLDDAGNWSAAFQPADVEVRGAPLAASTLEGGAGWTLSDPASGASAELAASGDADIQGSLYRVLQTDDGSLLADRYDLPIKGSPFTADLKGDAARPALKADDRDTPADEGGTELILAGTSFDVGALLDSGAADMPGPNMIAEARDEMAKLRDQVSALVDLFKDDGLTRAGLGTELGRKWEAAQKVVDGVLNGSEQLDRVDTPTRVVGAFDELVDALSTEDAFVAATAEDGGGVFEDYAVKAADAVKAYGRSAWEAKAALGTLGGTRFGAVHRRDRQHAEQGTPNQNERVQAFAFATVEPTRRASAMQASGNAYYEGRTVAVDTGRNFYEGRIELQVRFASDKVSGMVTDLQSDEGAWEHGVGGAVERIFLPDAALRRTLTWDKRNGLARLSYGAAAGSFRDVDVSGSAFQGTLLGRGDEAGEQAVGTWDVGGKIAGGFGAERGADRMDPGSTLIEDVTTTETEALLGTAKTEFTATELFLNDISDGTSGVTRDYKLKLDQLFGDGYELVGEDEDTLWAQQELRKGTHVAEAKKEITKLRNNYQKWIDFIDRDSSDADEATAQAEKGKLLDSLANEIDEHLFGAGGISSGLDILNEGKAYDSKTTNDAEVLARVDSALEALGSKDALADALADGGIFFRDSDNDDDNDFNEKNGGLSPDAIWNKPFSKVLLWTDRTDYTRFGAWRVQRSEYAADNSWVDQDNPDWMSEGTYKQGRNPEPFAYSPLPTTTYSGVGEAGYPGDGSARYVGTTVAVQDTIFLLGDVTARMTWDAETVGGDLVVTVSNLHSTDPGFGPLRHGYPDYPANATLTNGDNPGGRHTQARSGTFSIQSFSIRATVSTNADDEVVFEGEHTDASFLSRIEYDTPDGKVQAHDASGAPGHALIWNSRTQAHRVANENYYGPGKTGEGQLNVDSTVAASVDGSFVGRNADGPMGLIGTWVIKSSSSSYPNRHQIGIGNTRAPIYGAFGADVAP